MTFRPEVAVEAASLLAEVPASVNPWDDGAEELIQKDGAADMLWRLREEQDGPAG